jgi:hypothetical protein
MTKRKYQIYPQLLKMAEWRLDNAGAAEKTAFTPPQGDPMAGGAPPMDPMAAGGGAPPMDPMAAGGGMPPMDPMAAGGMPPMDPMAAGGGMPPMDPMAGGMPPGGGAGAVPPEIQAMVDQAVQAAMAGSGGALPGQGGTKKIDPAFMYMELSRIRKLMTNLYQHMGINLPDDILEDQTTAQSLMGGQPQSQPTDVPAAAGGGGGEPPALPGIGGQAPLAPIEPAKTAAARMGIAVANVGRPISTQTFRDNSQSLDVLAALSRSLNRRNAH